MIVQSVFFARIIDLTDLTYWLDLIPLVPDGT
jgi:hypothetical protein